MSKILVTGFQGFIGQRLCQILESSGYEVVPWKKNLDQLPDFNEKIDHIVHLAQRPLPSEAMRPEHYSIFLENQNGLMAAIELSRKSDAHLLFISSRSVYGIAQTELVSELHPLMPINSNGFSKAMSEQMMEFAVKRWQLHGTTLRLFNVYGQGQKDSYLVPGILSSVKNQKTMILRHPEHLRDFIHVDDVVDGIVKAIECSGQWKYEVFNLGSGSSISVSEVISMVEKASGKKVPVQCPDTLGAGRGTSEVASMIANTDKSRNLLSWAVKKSLMGYIISQMDLIK